MNSSSRLLVINAINLSGGGGRTILTSFLDALAGKLDETWRVTVFAPEDAGLPLFSRIDYVKPKLPGSSWVARAWFELFGLARTLRNQPVDTFISMQGSNARLPATRAFVYCHNAIAFDPMPFSQAMKHPHVAVRKLIYELLYRFGIGQHAFVVVQQSRVRKVFAERYGLRKCIVAYPVDGQTGTLQARDMSDKGPHRLVYPLAAWPHKNAEVVCEAARLLAKRGAGSFRLALTIRGDENSYARGLRHRYGTVAQIEFVGTLSLEELDCLYRSSDLLVFPSRLETWGLPLTEAKARGLGILAADLPYAHETIGDYDKVDFFDPDDASALADRIAACWSGRHPLRPASWPTPAEPFAPDWEALVNLILGDGCDSLLSSGP